MHNLPRTSLLLESLPRTLHDDRIQCVADGSRDLEVDSETRVGHDHLVQDVVRVADPRNGESLERGEGRRRRLGLEERLDVGEDLCRVV